MVALGIRERAIAIRDELRCFWREGRQPNRYGLEYLRGEARAFGVWHRIEQGDGRHQNTRYPFQNPSLDFKVVPSERLTRLNEAARGDRVALALCGLVFWPCDIDQFEPHGRRGESLIPHQIALAEAGHVLAKREDDIYLPEGIEIWDIPATMPNANQLSLSL